MNYKKFLISLKKDLLTANEKFPSVKFFRNDIVSVWIWFLILESFYSKKIISSEDIINSIPSKYCSRPKVFKILNYAKHKKFIEKILNNKDKRKYDLIPSKITINEFENWAKIFKGF